ncbi:MAG: hypothetical protein IKH04_11805 [Kiritimatiellae bacterium]|nr:hypothetical protein [Kiritimatiellia bacterium]
MTSNTRAFLAATAAVLSCAAAHAQSVSFSLSMTHQSYVVGELVELTFQVKNLGVSPIIISDYEDYRDNRLDIEVVSQNRTKLAPTRQGRIIEELSLGKDESQAFRIPLSDWFAIPEGHYQIRVRLYCNGLRYDSPLEVFDVVPGMELARASHFVSARPAVERTLRLVYWAREGHEYAFLRADDRPSSGQIRTMLLGDIMRVKKPSIERQPGDGGTFFIFRQVTRDTLSRTEIVSDATGIRVADVKRAVESASSPMIDNLREAVERRAGNKKKK